MVCRRSAALGLARRDKLKTGLQAAPGHALQRLPAVIY
jgi:hypothetical protein